jgi:hypothetical protein
MKKRNFNINESWQKTESPALVKCAAIPDVLAGIKAKAN